MNIDLEYSEQTHATKRLDYFPYIGDQLDALWRDINTGKFGETAKTGEWYLSIKAVKDKYPKG